MDSEKLGRSAQDWDIYRDALAPIQNKPIPKPWERAPVSAHAPRLQGRQIWKKAGIRSRIDKENDPSQAELDSVDARKRMRVAGEKINIGDAQWLVDSPKKVRMGEKIAVDKPEDAREQQELQFVPRKRTNTNRVITPRKPLRQTTLNSQAKTQALHTEAIGTVEKPARRRKSMRKSIRKSLALARAESTTTPAVALHLGDESRSESKAEDQKSVAQSKDLRKSVGEISKPEPVASTSASVQTSSEFSVADDVMVEESIPRDEPKQIVCGFETAPEVVNTLLDDHEDRQEDSPESSNLTANPSQDDTGNGNQGSDMCPKPSEAQPAILPSIEADSLELSQPPKAAGTPRGSPKKRKPTNTRRGTRRSTRARASSAKIEEQPVQDNMVLEIVETGSLDGPSPEAEVLQSVENSFMHEVKSSTDPAEVLAQVKENPIHQVDQTEGEATIGKDAVTIVSESTTPASHAILRVELVSAEFEGHTGELSGPPDNVAEDFNVVQEAVDNVAITEIPEVNLEEFDLAPSKNDLSETSIPDILSIGTVATDSLDITSDIPSLLHFSPTAQRAESPASSDEQTVEILETLESVFVPADETLSFKLSRNLIKDLPENSTPDPSTSELVETISENATTTTYDHDDTDMLRNFLTRVKANKAAKAEKSIPKRKRSLPHSLLQIPLGEVETITSPTETKDNFETSVLLASPSKRRKRKDQTEDELAGEPEAKLIRRSGRTRLPVVKSPVAAPSFIPVRRLGQDGDTTVTLRRSEEKELAALTRVNTRKNKAGALPAAEVLVKKAEEKDDPALRQRLLKEVFDEKAQKNKKEKKPKSVAWAVEIAQYQDAGGKKVDTAKDVKEKEKVVEEKKGAVKVGVRSKIALGVAVNGTPTSKRKSKEKP